MKSFSLIGQSNMAGRGFKHEVYCKKEHVYETLTNEKELVDKWS